MPANSKSREARLIKGDSKKAPILVPELVGKVALIVTSPPYHNAISYGSHAANPLGDYRERVESNYETEYLEFLSEIWSSCWKMLKPGGIIAVNVGSVLENGHHYPLPLDIAQQFESSQHDWKFVKDIMWHKVTAGVKRAGSVIQNPYPGYWHPNIMSEHILLFMKRGTLKTNHETLPQEWLESVWDIAPVPPRTVEHPAPFPEDIPHRLISLFTSPGDLVMDPFNGAGSTSKAAFDLGRRSLGFDLEANYIKYAKNRLGLASMVRKKQLSILPVKQQDFVAKKPNGSVRQGTGQGSRRGQLGK